MKNVVEADVAIIGGGIAGLWLLNRLRQLGFSVILLESATLGGGQTHKAQGIIHSGMKYALNGSVTSAAEAISKMPIIWQACLQGKGELDLSAVPVLSSHQYLWTTGGVTSKLAGFFAGLALKGNVNSLDSSAFPEVFKNPQFKGHVYSLDEIVIDVNALIRELVKPNQDVIYKIDPIDAKQINLDEHNQLVSFEIRALPMTPVRLQAKKYVFTAAGGNDLLLKKFKNVSVGMQRRPLHMVVVKHNHRYPVYAHCLGLGVTPRITITTHQAHDGRIAWYLGGQIAEEGVKRNEAEQIDFAKKELEELFPWLDFSKAEFSCFRIDRVEAMQPGGKRPDTCHIEEIGNTILAWPTKLAFAPLLAEKIAQCLLRDNVKSGISDTRELRAWPMPSFAKPVWD